MLFTTLSDMLDSSELDAINFLSNRYALITILTLNHDCIYFLDQTEQPQPTEINLFHQILKVRPISLSFS